MKNAAIALLLAALSFSASAADFTVHPEVGAGLNHYAIVQDGTWYQIGMPHTIQRNGRAWLAGITGDLFHKDIGWASAGLAYHLDYVNLGHARADCYCTTIDADYSHVTQRLVLPQSVVPMAHYSGNGMVQGIKIALAPYFNVGQYRFGYEYGEYIYRAGWRDTVYGWTPYVGSGISATGSNTTPSHPRHGRVFGLFLQHGNVTLSYEHYRLPISADEWNTPPLYIGAQTLMLTYQF